MKSNKIYKTYLDLLKKHGDPVILWPQWCAKRKNNTLREIIAMGAILTQKTSWHNANLALKNLKKENLLSLNKVASLANLKNLTRFTKPAGFYQTKPKRLFILASFIIKEYGNLRNFREENLNIARDKLLGLYGIGPETADTILLYALDKPTFVVDEYTRRLVKQIGISRDLNYDSLKRILEENLPNDPIVFQNLHALIIIEQKGRKCSSMEIVE